jgi:cytoskeletal protein RodZ
MKKNNFLHILKKANSIKILILILLILLIIGVLFYNKKILEAMTTINIYTTKQDYKVNEEPSSNVAPYNSNEYSENSNTDNASVVPYEPDSKTVDNPSESVVEAAPKASQADTTSSKIDSGKKNINENLDAIKNKTSSYTNAFTDPLKQTQTETETETP